LVDSSPHLLSAARRTLVGTTPEQPNKGGKGREEVGPRFGQRPPRRVQGGRPIRGRLVRDTPSGQIGPTNPALAFARPQSSSGAWPPGVQPSLAAGLAPAAAWETPVADRGERAARRAVRPRRAGEAWPRGVPARPNRAIQVKGLAESNSRLSSRRRQTRLAVVQAGSFRDNPRKPCSDWLLCRGSGASRELLLSRESGQ
jgi:hypothetical protein